MDQPDLPPVFLLDLDDTILVAGDPADLWETVTTTHIEPLELTDPHELIATLERERRWYWSDPDRHRVGRHDLFHARREIVSAAFASVGIEAPDIANRLANDFSRQREGQIHLFDGAVESLSEFRRQGVRLALITNGASRPQWAKINQFQLAAHFEYIAVEGDLGYGKPNPRVFQHVLAQLDASPDDCWMVGDNLEWDIAAPQRLGITGIWHDHDAQGLPAQAPSQPDRIITRLRNLLPNKTSRPPAP